MRSARVALPVVIVGALVIIIAYVGWRHGGPNQFEAAFTPGGKVALDLSAGGYNIRGTPENRIRVEIDSHDIRDVRCNIDVSGTSAKVILEGPSNNFRATIYVPQRSDLKVDQTIGDLVVTNVEGNKDLGLNIGRLQVEVASGAAQPSFDGSVNLGSLRAGPWNVEKGGFFRDYATKSASPYAVRAHVDIGDLEVSQAASLSKAQ